MKSIKFSLAWQILFAMVLGILLGSYLHYQRQPRLAGRQFALSGG